MHRGIRELKLQSKSTDDAVAGWGLREFFRCPLNVRLGKAFRCCKKIISILVLHLLNIIRKTGRFREIAERVVRSRVAVSSQGQG